MPIVGISLGSNLGEKLLNLCAARDRLIKLMPSNASHTQAPIFQSSPINCPEGSPNFLNTAIEIEFDGTPEQLLEKTQALEILIGRTPKVILNEPRLIDIDILYFENILYHSSQLELPHPRIAERRFVLAPLSKICPDRILPNQALTILDLLKGLPEDEQNLVELQSSW